MRVLNILILINTYVTEKKTYWMSKTFGDNETSISFYFYCQKLFIQIMPSMHSSTFLSFFVESLDWQNFFWVHVGYFEKVTFKIFFQVHHLITMYTVQSRFSDIKFSDNLWYCILQRPFFNLLYKIIRFSDIMRFSDSFCKDQKCH